MTQEEKDLLLKYLLARLPYDVEAQVFNNIEGESKPFVVNKPVTFDDIEAFVKNDVVIDIKPYLRPMVSMTFDEEQEANRLVGNGKCINTYGDIHCYNNGESVVDINNIAKYIDFLNAHHFDYHMD